MSRNVQLVDLAAFHTAIDKDVADIEHEILNGRCSDYAHYRNRVGERKGLLNARKVLREVLKNTEDSD